MVCYVYGVTPSNGNARTDLIAQDGKQQAVAPQKTASEKLQDEYRKLYNEAKKANDVEDIKLLEEKEKELDIEKTRLEIELELENQKHTPEGYKSMSTIELYDEFTKAVKNKSPQLETIIAEIQRRLLANIHVGLAE